MVEPVLIEKRQILENITRINFFYTLPTDSSEVIYSDR